MSVPLRVTSGKLDIQPESISFHLSDGIRIVPCTVAIEVVIDLADHHLLNWSAALEAFGLLIPEIERLANMKYQSGHQENPEILIGVGRISCVTAFSALNQIGSRCAERRLADGRGIISRIVGRRSQSSPGSCHMTHCISGDRLIGERASRKAIRLISTRGNCIATKAPTEAPILQRSTVRFQVRLTSRVVPLHVEQVTIVGMRSEPASSIISASAFRAYFVRSHASWHGANGVNVSGKAQTRTYQTRTAPLRSHPRVASHPRTESLLEYSSFASRRGDPASRSGGREGL